MSRSQADLNALVERYLSGEGRSKAATFSELTGRLKRAIDDDDAESSASALRRVVDPAMDYTSAISLYRIRRRLADKLRRPAKLRIAILSSFTTDQLEQLLDLFLFAAGLEAELYVADYGLFRQEILDATSGLYAFKPSFIFIGTTWRDLARRPTLSDADDTVRMLVEAECNDWMGLWKIAYERLGSQIIQNCFDSPPWRQLGNHEMRHPAGFGRFIARVNGGLADAAPPFVTLHDVEHLAASAGRWAWGDERFYHHAKLPCAPAYLVDYAHSVASILSAQAGVGKKCLVLDLDNTLWGGVIGDDGLGGIRLGQGDPESEGFSAFQKFVKALRMRGVILAVCSKNEESTAREVFEKHAEMDLRLEDISCFVANWDDKASNIRTIAQRLDIGLNSMVFVDDNPAERAIVRQLLPEVAVPELPADPSGYIWAVDKHRYFQVASLSTEDFRRTDFYKANEARVHAQSSTQSIDEFLASLEMVARVAPIDATSIERSVQLTSRSNQFNLTTKRYSSGEVLAMLQDPAWITRTVSLADRFGDNGLICVLLGRIEGDALAIDTWLMSCRVLKRGVELFLLEQVLAIARECGLKKVLGEYIPTAKNALVRDHYRTLGFAQVWAGENGHTKWELAVDGMALPPRTHIRLTPERMSAAESTL
jgi:FkbH-like protein